jgi:hypothetical protein
MQMVVTATTLSVRQMWETAAGRKPASLTDVLDLLPAPNLDPAIYPGWKARDWGSQLRHAAGEPVGMPQDPMTRGRNSDDREPQPADPKGSQLGAGPFSFRTGCVNLTSVFSYEKFVVPELERIRKEYNERFYVGAADQIVAPTETPKPQASVVGHAIAGAAIGALTGAGIGLLVGGPIGAVIGGVIGLVAGAFIGGLIGKERKQ